MDPELTQISKPLTAKAKRGVPCLSTMLVSVHSFRGSTTNVGFSLAADSPREFQQ